MRTLAFKFEVEHHSVMKSELMADVPEFNCEVQRIEIWPNKVLEAIVFRGMVAAADEEQQPRHETLSLSTGVGAAQAKDKEGNEDTPRTY